MSRLFSFWLIVFLVGSCYEKGHVVEYIGNKQKLNLNYQDASGNSINDIKLITHIPDSIYTGEQSVFKLTTSNSTYKIVRAYFDCSIDTSSLIDTVSYRLNICEKELAVINDTIVVALKPQKVGESQFPETIVAISRGEDGIFRYRTGTFSYQVIEK